jgi:hypothetical protein
MLQGLSAWPANRPIRLNNSTCPYCGSAFSDNLPATVEHVIGRRFVPRGALNNCWNLILNACRICNNIKSDLEDDLSAITLQPEISGRMSRDDPTLLSEAFRKSQNSISRRNKKRVSDSREKITVHGNLMGTVSFVANFECPPQADDHRLRDLARLHLQAFFYWLTYDTCTKRGGFWRGGCYWLMEARRADWGNPTMRAFMATVLDWEPRLVAIGADGYFKVTIRKSPSAATWSWGLEWNESYRLVGFFGDRAAAQREADRFPRIRMESIYETPTSFMRFSVDEPLNDADDLLFAVQS